MLPLVLALVVVLVTALLWLSLLALVLGVPL